MKKIMLILIIATLNIATFASHDRAKSSILLDAAIAMAKLEMSLDRYESFGRDIRIHRNSLNKSYICTPYNESIGLFVSLQKSLIEKIEELGTAKRENEVFFETLESHVLQMILTDLTSICGQSTGVELTEDTIRNYRDDITKLRNFIAIHI